MMKYFTTCTRIFILLSLLVFLAPQSFAGGIKLKTDKGAPVLVNADNYSGDSDAHVMELSGHVHVIYSEQAISCDHAVIHDLTNEIEADGHLVIDSPTVHVEGERASLNYKTSLGTIEKGFVVSGQIMLEGERILKMGPEEYIAEQGNYTACTTCPPAWGFRAREIDAQLGGYARLKSVLFEVLNFPILWLPYLIVPLKSDRQSGFLIPHITIAPATNDAKGFQVGFSESYFWAIDRSQDATFTASSNPANGIKGAIDYRYFLSDTSQGGLSMGALHDKLFNGAKSRLYPTLTPTQQASAPTLADNFTRWYFHYEHHYDLPDGFTQNTKLNLLSDFLYPADNPEDFMSIVGERALESRFTLSKNTESTHSSVDTSYYINLLKSDPLNGQSGSIISGNGDAVHRAPEIRYSVVNSKIGNTGFLFHTDTNYVHFARQDAAYDDLQQPHSDAQCPAANAILNIPPTCKDPKTGTCGPCYDASRGLNRQTGKLATGTGQFDPVVDAMRTGDRFDFHPEVSYPFQIAHVIDIVPAVSYRFMQYNFDISPNNPDQSPQDSSIPGYDTHPSRSYFTESLSARTRFDKVWGTDPGNPHEVKYKHEFEPELRITSLSGMHETQSPFLNSNDQTPEFLIDQPITDTDIYPFNTHSLQFDYNDRIASRNVITGLITNKIVKKTWTKSSAPPINPDFKSLSLETNAEEPNYLQIMSFKVWQSYDLDAATQPVHRYPWTDLDGLFDFRFQFFESNLLLRYYPYQNVTTSSLRAKVFDSTGDYFQFTYNQSFKITENLDDANYDNPDSHAESIGLGVGLTKHYFKLVTDINLNPEDFRKSTYAVNSWDALVGLTPPGNCWGVGFKFIHVLNGNGTSVNITFDYQFGGGNTPAPVPGTTTSPASPPASMPAKTS